MDEKTGPSEVFVDAKTIKQWGCLFKNRKWKYLRRKKHLGAFMIGALQQNYDTFLSYVVNFEAKSMFWNVKQWEEDMYV